MSELDFVNNKDLGQHWLNDLDALRAIVDLAELNSSDHVLEIGPGPGALTELLLNQADQVVAVEIDQALICRLDQRFNDKTNLTIVNNDIRHFDFSDLPLGYKVVANIPYYLSGYLIRRLSESNNPPSLCVLLVQKEVAERLSAKPGKLSLLGVTAQAYWEVDLGLIIPAHSFTPPPKVDSQVVRLNRRTKIQIPENLNEQFFGLINTAFNQRRKTLANSLSVGLKLDKRSIIDYLQSAGVAPLCRPQELSLNEWIKLTQAIYAKKA